MQYYLNRFLPFLKLFLIIEFTIRLVLLIKSHEALDFDVSLLKVFLVGFIFDLTVFSFLALPYSLYLIVLPRKKHGSIFDHLFSSISFLAFSTLIGFSALSEWFFWDEFSNRFNFIAVDYLIYTHEVIGNIWESYPVVRVLGALFLICLGLTYFFYQNFKQNHSNPSLPSPSKSLFILLGFIALNLVSFETIDSKLSQISNNKIIQEISKNGIFEFFSAYRQNELDFQKFYVTANQELLNQTLRKQLNNHKSPEPLSRYIQNPGEEHHYNIILITVESLSAKFMHAFGNRENLTPNLDKILDESLSFNHFYAIGTRTVYGLTALNLSIPPLPGNAIIRRPQNEGLFSIASVLNSKGYRSNFIYGGFGYFDNMNYFFENNGYQIIDRAQFKPEEITFSNIWGIADEDVFNRTLLESDQSYAQGQPFFQMIMTTSNHRPYSYPEQKIDIPSGSGRNGAVKYTDYAIGQFINAAKTKPWFYETLFVIVADHTASSSGKNEIDPTQYHIPCMIYAPHLIKPQTIETLASQIDLAPTILGLLNLDYQSRFYGQNLLTESPNRAFLSNYQKIAYLTPDELIILSPGKQIKQYHLKEGELLEKTNENQNLLLNALSYLQTANQWKVLNQEIG